MEQEDNSAIEQLFVKAQKEGGFEYLYVLVRIDGIQLYEGYQDKMVVLRDWLKQPETSDPTTAYRFLVDQSEPLDLLQNLLNLSNNKHYELRPFLYLAKGQFPNRTWPTTQEKVEALIDNAKTSGFPELAAQILAGYPPALFNVNGMQEGVLKQALESLLKLLNELINRHFSERLKFKNAPKYMKLPGSLDVLELLTDEEFGLSGLRVHFPQNCTAEFIRTPQGVSGMNFEFGPPVTFLMMSTEPSTNEYRVNGKRLYEIGLPGRYNKLGEWKPLIYPGKSDYLIKESMELSDDPDVQGVFLYLRLTGHRCIEFVLRANMELPWPYTSTKERNLHIWKCPPDEHAGTNPNVRIYDCWMDLEGHRVDEVESALAGIAYLVNVLCLPFDAIYSWRIKYRMTMGGTNLLTPSHDDLEIVDEILQKFPAVQDAAVLMAAIDWYNRGSMSSNVFNRFLCYYIALESVAVAIASGAELGRESPLKPNKKEKLAQAIACIQAKHAEVFPSDPIRFVNESYFECVQSVTAKTKAGVTSVFGEGHGYLKLLFEESSGGDKPLKDLRSDLAHGDATLMDKRHENLVRKHLYEMGRITREFLLRVLFRLEPSNKPPSWSGAFQQSFSTADPRSTMVVSTDSIFPRGTDWKIRAEWCE